MKQNYYFITLFAIAMMVSGSFFAQADCDPTGDGNPGLLDNGQGQGTGDYDHSGELAWDLLLSATSNCVFSENAGLNSRCVNRNVRPLNSLQHVQNVKIAIIDSGVRPTSPGYLNESPLISYTVSPAGQVTSGVAYPHPHGTYSAGVISSMMKNSSQAHTFYDYQVLNDKLRTSLAAVVAAIDHAVYKGVNVISLSLGFLPSECDNIDWENPNSPLHAAIIRASAAGVVVVTSAGNDGNDLAEAPQYPAAYNNVETLVSVGALNCQLDAPAPFSNFGDDVVDVFTLGTDITIRYGYCYFNIHGTSFATSIVAGKAAIHFAMGSDTRNVICQLRGQTTPFSGVQYAIYGIVDRDGSNPDANCPREGSFPREGKSLEVTDAPVLKATPNPFQDQLKINLGVEGEDVSVSIFDGRGRQILSQRTNKADLTLNLDQLATGIYYLVVQDAQGSRTRTVVKK